MDLTQQAALAGLGIVLLLIFVRLFRAPLALMIRLAGNTALGFGALWVTQWVGSFVGISLGLNLWNALVIAILGLPGLVLLLLTQWTLL